MEQLPDLPGSTPEDLRKNQFHGFFKKTPREVWESATIEQIEMEEKPKCSHVFIQTEEGIECTKCRMGLIGNVPVETEKPRWG